MTIIQAFALIFSLFAFVNSIYSMTINLIECRRLRDELSRLKSKNFEEIEENE